MEIECSDRGEDGVDEEELNGGNWSSDGCRRGGIEGETGKLDMMEEAEEDRKEVAEFKLKKH